MALNIIKDDASFKMADSLSTRICKVFNDSQIAKSHASGSLMECYAHISRKIVKFNMC